jgi:hypothetical protein
MTVTIELPRDLESRLQREALEQGVALPDYIVGLLSHGAASSQQLSGRELIDYWEREGLIGLRPEIQDSQSHARALRAQAECRDRL